MKKKLVALCFLNGVFFDAVAYSGEAEFNFHPENVEVCLESLSSGQILSQNEIEGSGFPNHYFKDKIMLSVSKSDMFETRLYFKRNGSVNIHCSIAK